VRLPWLLEITEPADRIELLEQMTADLVTARRDLLEGLRSDDVQRLVGGCHILVSLVGTLGDGALTARLQALQRQLRQGDASARDDAGHSGLADELDILQAELAEALQRVHASDRDGEGA
jgi:hypothetical protein